MRCELGSFYRQNRFCFWRSNWYWIELKAITLRQQSKAREESCYWNANFGSSILGGYIVYARNACRSKIKSNSRSTVILNDLRVLLSRDSFELFLFPIRNIRNSQLKQNILISISVRRCSLQICRRSWTDSLSHFLSLSSLRALAAVRGICNCSILKISIRTSWMWQGGQYNFGWKLWFT